MGIAVVKSGKFRDPELGLVTVRVLETARRLTARVTKGALHLTIPAMMPYDEFLKVLETWRPELIRMLGQATDAQPQYHDGYRFDNGDFGFCLVCKPIKNRAARIPTITDDSIFFTIEYGDGLDLQCVEHRRFITKMIMDAAHNFVGARLLPTVAKPIAAELDCRPADWGVSRGFSRLGYCTADKVVTLSEVVAFLPPLLRRYVITHELTHLTHMDHSPAFYELWERYMGEPVGPLRETIKAFAWPVMK